MREFHDSSQLTVTEAWLPTRFFPWIGQALQAVLSWAARHRQRRHLARLDQALLRDIGLTNQDVQQEISKPFWRL